MNYKDRKKRTRVIWADEEFYNLLKNLDEQEQKGFRLLTRDIARNYKNKKKRVIL